MELLRLAKAKATAEAIGVDHTHQVGDQGGVFITIPDNTRGFPANVRPAVITAGDAELLNRGADVIEGEAAAEESSEDAA